MNKMTATSLRATSFAILLAALAALCGPASAQEGGPPPPPDAKARQGAQGKQERRDRVEQIERMKQMRMIEALDLGEEEAVRFMAKRKEHEDRIRELAEERGSVLDALQNEVGPVHATRRSAPDTERGAEKQAPAPGEKAAAQIDAPAVDKEITRVLEQDRKMFDERKRYQEEMRKFLGTEKFAKLLLFERDFQMQVRDAVGRSAKRRGGKFDE